MTAPDASLLAVLLASFGGSLHCVGMCGPFAAVAASGPAMGRGALWRLQALYAAGRLVTYSVLGVLAGLVGRALDLAGEAVGLSRVAAGVAALIMLGGGVLGLLRYLGSWPRHVRASKGGAAQGRLLWRLSAWVARLDRFPPSVRAFLVGLLTTWLPCGWLYAFVALAAGTGGVLPAFAVMTAFWMGTVPALLGVGLGANLGALRLRRRAPLLLSLGMLLVGGWGLWHRAPWPSSSGASGAAPSPSCHRAAPSSGG